MGNSFNEINTQSIKSPEGVVLLMENLWLRHRAGMKQKSNNVFMVELPPLSEEERRAINKSDTFDYDQEELFGGFV